MAINFSRLVIGPCVAVFGQAVSYTPVVSDPGGTAFQVRGIFKAEHHAISPDYRGDGDQFAAMAVSTQGPVLAVRLCDLPHAPRAGDQVDVSGASYQVWDVMFDGEGKADLALRTL